MIANDSFFFTAATTAANAGNRKHTHTYTHSQAPQSQWRKSHGDMRMNKVAIAHALTYTHTYLHNFTNIHSHKPPPLFLPSLFVVVWLYIFSKIELTLSSYSRSATRWWWWTLLRAGTIPTMTRMYKKPIKPHHKHTESRHEEKIEGEKKLIWMMKKRARKMIFFFAICRKILCCFFKIIYIVVLTSVSRIAAHKKRKSKDKKRRQSHVYISIKPEKYFFFSVCYYI